jgi:mRNA export factor
VLSARFSSQQHDAPIKTAHYIDELQVLVTGSWDKTLRYWDGRSPTPVATVNLPERAYCMDVAYPLAVVATAERHILIYNLTNPKVEYKVRFCFNLGFIFCLQ